MRPVSRWDPSVCSCWVCMLLVGVTPSPTHLTRVNWVHWMFLNQAIFLGCSKCWVRKMPLMDTGQRFFAAMYGQSPGTSMSEARHSMYSRKTGKPMRVMALPPTETNLYLHVRRAHLQTMLWKAADQQGPPNVDITKFGWEVKEGIPSPCIATGIHAPQGLIDVINCGCKAEGKACSTESCSCHKNNMSCTVYCACSAVDGCCNPFTMREDGDDESESDDELDDN